MASQPKLQFEGMNITMGADQNTAIYFIDSRLEEVQVRTSGNDAEVSTPGVSMVAIMKSGGNNFHGAYRRFDISRAVSRPTISTTKLKAQNIGAPPQLKSFYDYAADLGGRIIRDKLWFYGGYAKQSKSEGTLGFAADPGPDGQVSDGRRTSRVFRERPLPVFAEALVSDDEEQPARLRVAARDEGAAAERRRRFRPLEATRDYKNPTAIQKAEWQSTMTPAAARERDGRLRGYVTDYDAAARLRGPMRRAVRISKRDCSRAPTSSIRARRAIDIRVRSASASSRRVRLAGQHDFKTGVSLYYDRTSDAWLNNLAGNYVLITDRIGGVSGTPSRIRIYNTPVFAARQRRHLRVVFQGQLACPRVI